MSHSRSLKTPVTFPVIRTAGVDGMLVSFGDALDEAANRAALAFRAALDQADWEGVEETSTSLVSAYLRFDPLHVDHKTMRENLQGLLDQRDWFGADLPEGRRFWRVPAVFGTDLAPQLSQAAQVAGLTEAEAIKSLTETRLRVQTIGFALGQPYLGTLPEAWDIPRQSQLTKRVPDGAVAVAIRQLVMFSVPMPTGWMHVAQTAMRLFQPDADEPFLLRPGDEVQYTATTSDALAQMRHDPIGGAVVERIV